MNQQHRLPARLFLLSSVIGLMALLNALFLPGETRAPSRVDCTGKGIVFVAKNLKLQVRDSRLVDHLIAAGHQVTVRPAKEVQATDTLGQDLVIISESADSFDIEDRLNEIAVPIVTWEGWLQDNLGMTGPVQFLDYGELLRETQIEIVDDTHPLAAGLTGVVTTIATANDRFHWGMPNANAVVIATVPGYNTWVYIYAYEQGAQMVNRVAPARRIFIHNATGNNLNANGWAIFDAAVNWAMDCSMPTATPTATATNTPLFTPTASQTRTPSPGLTPTSSATPTSNATPTPGSVMVTVAKTDLLFIDADGNEIVSPGDTVIYTIRVRNHGERALANLQMEDRPDVNTTLRVGSVQTDRGAVVQGNNLADQQAIVQIDTLPSRSTAQISLQVVVKPGVSSASLHNQAIVRYQDSANQPDGQSVTLSDDPDTAQPLDTTVTLLGSAVEDFQIFLPFTVKLR